jgi:hypothetical protein
MLLVRRPISPIAFDALPSPIRGDLETGSQRLAQLPRISVGAVRTAPDRCFERLTHRLSDAYIELNSLDPDLARSEAEFDALAWFEARGEPFPGSSARSFRESLGALNARLTNHGGTWRRNNIGLNADKAGSRIRLPGPEHIPAQLAKLRRLWSDELEAPALLKATIALALTVNCHPFTDGNGRVARVLFNQWLRRGGMPADAYFPFAEIARRSRGGYEIALRIVELQGNWDALANFVLEAVRCYRNIAERQVTD